MQNKVGLTLISDKCIKEDGKGDIAQQISYQWYLDN